MTNRQNWVLLKIFPFPLIGLIYGLGYWVIERGLLGDLSTYPSSSVPYNPTYSFVAVAVTSIFLGLGLGLIEETIFKTYFQSRSFVLKILIKTTLYVAFLILLLFGINVVLNSLHLGVNMFSIEAFRYTKKAFFSSFVTLSLICYSGFAISSLLVFSDITQYLGLDVVTSFFTGKYNKSVVEKRIFMFLDMKESTSIAERLGHRRHYKFINEYYGDMTDAIVDTKGRIYQYVGDEIVISWNLKDGTKNANCLECFFLIRQAIQKKKTTYEEKFGVLPEFRAGMHVGEVTRGQVGFIKKDLLFTGDVLNTTARIQSMCKELSTDFLMSGSLRALIHTSYYDFKEKGSYSLRGRVKEETLVEVISKSS